MSLLPTATPKQTLTHNDRDWYPYYAAYSEAFVSNVFDAYLAGATSILDPWAGSGTTNAVSYRRGVSSVGLDINPASLLIAKGRLAPPLGEPDGPASPLELVSIASNVDLGADPTDPLSLWFVPDAVGRLRALEHAAYVALSIPPRTTVPNGDRTWLNALSPALSFLYCVLFLTVRRMLRPYTTTNPMWFKTSLDSNFLSKLNPSWPTLSQAYRDAMSYLSGRLTQPIGNPPTTEFQIGNATDLSFTFDRFDAVLTSPPYATRLDYVKGMLPELAVLGLQEEALSKLRANTTGTPVVRKLSRLPPYHRFVESESACLVLDRVKEHSSKGSRNYYYPWVQNYFLDLQESAKELARVTTNSGTICLVVQNSYYKDIPIDLQDIVTELFLAVGRRLRSRRDYSAPNSRSPSGTVAEASTRCSTESLLVFQ